MFSRRLSKSIAVAGAALALAGSAFGIVSATSSSSSSTANAATTPAAGSSASTGHLGSGGAGSNARSGPAAGGASGTVTSVFSSDFTLKTMAGQKVTVNETSSTAYENDANPDSANAVTKSEPVLVLGTVDSSTITASQVIVQPTSSGFPPSSAGNVVPFKRGAQSTSKTVGQIPANYQQGSGTLVSGTAAGQATTAALAAYPGGIIDRVVRLSGGEYEVHNIGVNWPHHIFVNRDFKVVGAD